MPEGRGARRVDTAVQMIFNNKFNNAPQPKNATYSFNGISTTGDAVPCFWTSPRQTGTLHEKTKLAQELRKAEPGPHTYLPSYVLRDRGFVASLTEKGLTHDALGLSRCELQRPVPFSVNNDFFRKKNGEFITLDRREAVTRHHWGVLNFNDTPPTRGALPPLQSQVPPNLLQYAPPPLPGQRGGRTEGGLKVGRGFVKRGALEGKGEGKWVLRYVPAAAAASLRGIGAASSWQRSASSMGHRDPSTDTRANVATSAPRAKSQLAAHSPGVSESGEDAFQGCAHVAAKQSSSDRRLLRTLRQKMQAKFNDTSHLPINLWKAFKRFDLDSSGRMEFLEFQRLCTFIGLDAFLNKSEVKLLFNIADRNGGGGIDFQEFLSAVVGNLVNL